MGDGLLGDAEQYRAELHLHCYRMLGNFEEAEDLVQETLLRAWRARAEFDQTNLRAWLYRIATNACLDALRKPGRQVESLDSYAEVPWLQPFPDRLLPADEPVAAAIAKETVELAYIAVIQLLPPRQRAVLMLRDVLGWSATETADTLQISVPATNSALQRARATLRERAPGREEAGGRWQPSEWERRLLDGYISAHQRGDYHGMIALMHEDIRVTMPPHPMCYHGHKSLLPLFDRAFANGGMGQWRLRPVWANHQPAAISYLQRPGDTEFRAFKIDVMRATDRKICEITTFGPELTASFSMPSTLP
ncbi:RNA polymerase subunit sigma-70 [Microbispora siamensis]